jgi:anti-sigma factor RsiW
MECRGNTDLVNQYLDGALSPAERADFVRHLATCPACQAELAQSQALFRLIEGLEEAPVPLDLKAEVLAGLPRHRLWPAGRWILLVQAAATVLLFWIALPRLAMWYEALRAWMAPGWLSSAATGLIAWPAAAWQRWQPAWGVDSIDWPQGWGLTPLQAVLLVAALAGMWWLSNRLLLLPERNHRGGLS